MHAPRPSDPEPRRTDDPSLAGVRIAPAPKRTHRWGFGAFFLAEGVFVLVSVLLSAHFGHLSQTGPRFAPALLLSLVLPSVLAAGAAVLITVVRGNGPRADFGLRWSWSDVRTGLGIGGVGLVTTTVATELWVAWAGPAHANSAITELIGGGRIPPAVAVLVFLHVWLVAPLCEELLYRGLLWGAMERLRWGQLAVFALSTAMFAIGHLEPERTWLLLVIALPIGAARLVTGRLTASVVAHQVNNFLPALGILLISLGLMPAA